MGASKSAHKIIHTLLWTNSTRCDWLPDVEQVTFEWDPVKDAINRLKHGVSFDEAQRAFADPYCVLAEDTAHGKEENRLFCFGRVDGNVLTVRFLWRNGVIRIFGAGYWRKGKQIYEREKKIH
jgi:uncharacterized DUF497 family protein